MSNKEIADATIGSVDSSCNYSDFCADFDGFRVQLKIKELSEEMEENYHLLSDALNWYYGNALYRSRFKWICDELDCSQSLSSMNRAINNKMNTKAFGVGGFGFLTVATIKGGNPSQEVYDLCCESLAKYIFSMNQ